MPYQRILPLLGSTLLLLLVGTLKAQPRDARFQRWTTDDGLSQSNVLAILQDATGFLWIGTQDGLHRFDGHTFKIYQRSDTDTLSLVDDFIRALYEDRNGRFWIGTKSGGLHRMDRSTGSFTSYPIPGAERSNQHNNPNEIFAIQEDAFGRLWLGTGAGLARFNPEAEKITHFATPDSAAVRSLLLDQKHRLWVGYGKGGKGSLLRFSLPEPTSRLPAADTLLDNIEGSVMALQEGPDTRIWVATYGSGLWGFTDNTLAPLHFKKGEKHLPSNLLTKLLMSRSGTLWIGTNEDGLARLAPGKDEFEQFTHQETDRYSLNNKEVYALAEGQNGTLWVGTLQGLNAWSNLRQGIEVVAHRPNSTFGLSNPNVVALYEDTAGLWVGTWGGGLNFFNKLTGEVQIFRHNSSDPSSIGYDHIFAIRPGRRNDLWIATYGGGLSRLDRATMTFNTASAYANTPNSLRDKYVTAVLLDRTGTLWISTQFGGLHRMNTDTGHITQLYPHTLGAPYTWPLLEDHTGLIWIGTYDAGLFSYDPTTDAFTAYTHQAENPQSLSGNRVYTLFEDAGHTLWIGTTEGLNRFDAPSGTFQVFRTEHGLANNHVTGILQDDLHGHLWISTNNGLSRFDPQSASFVQTYAALDGLQNNRFYVGSAFKNNRGELLFGGQGGFNIIDPRKLGPLLPPPPVVLTGFKVKGRAYTPPNCPRCDPSQFKRIELNHDQNFFTFTFAALDFSNVSANQYRYRLEGLQNEAWNQNGNSNEAIYTSVPHGQYTIQVTAANRDRVWSETGLSLPLLIHAPFWDTWWFKTIGVLAFLGLLASAYVYRVRQLLRVERLRMQIAGNLHDDIGANLSSIALKSQMVGLDRRLEDQDQDLLNDVTRMAKETTFKLREIVWVVNTGYDSLDKLISKMEDAAGMLLNGVVSYSFEAPMPPPTRPISMDFRQNVYFLYKESLQNIVKHAQATHVSIVLIFDAGIFVYIVQDDGIGFDTSNYASGNGLNNMHRRAEAVRGTLTVETTSEGGTRVELRAPVP